jgi:hypothetical protein
MDNFPEIMTEEELIQYLRIPEISNSKNYHNVVENLKRMHDLPRIHICGKALYPRNAITEWGGFNSQVQLSPILFCYPVNFFRS